MLDLDLTNNRAPLGKRLWGIAGAPQPLVARTFKEKYGPPEGPCLDTHKNSSNLTRFWQDITLTKGMIWYGLSSHFGDGKCICFLRDRVSL